MFLTAYVNNTLHLRILLQYFLIFKIFFFTSSRPVLAASMLTGCAEKESKTVDKSQVTAEESGKGSSKNGNSKGSALVEQIKTKYAGESNYDYAEPLYKDRKSVV